MKNMRNAMYNCMAALFIVISWGLIYSVSLHWDRWSDLGFMNYNQFAGLFLIAIALNTAGWFALVVNRK